MSNFRISPLAKGKPIHKKKYLSWLLLFIVIETLAAGFFMFRQQQRIDFLEIQVNTQQHNGENHV